MTLSQKYDKDRGQATHQLDVSLSIRRKIEFH